MLQLLFVLTALQARRREARQHGRDRGLTQLGTIILVCVLVVLAIFGLIALFRHG